MRTHREQVRTVGLSFCHWQLAHIEQLWCGDWWFIVPEPEARCDVATAAAGRSPGFDKSSVTNWVSLGATVLARKIKCHVRWRDNYNEAIGSPLLIGHISWSFTESSSRQFPCCVHLTPCLVLIARVLISTWNALQLTSRYTFSCLWFRRCCIGSDWSVAKVGFIKNKYVGVTAAEFFFFKLKLAWKILVVLCGISHRTKVSTFRVGAPQAEFRIS